MYFKQYGPRLSPTKFLMLQDVEPDLGNHCLKLSYGIHERFVLKKLILVTKSMQCYQACTDFTFFERSHRNKTNITI